MSGPRQDGELQRVGRGKLQGERKVKRQWGKGQEKEKRQKMQVDVSDLLEAGKRVPAKGRVSLG